MSAWPRDVAHVFELARGHGLEPERGAEEHVYLRCPVCGGDQWASARPSSVSPAPVLDCAGCHDFDGIAAALMAPPASTNGHTADKEERRKRVLTGLAHAEAMALEVRPANALVEDVVERGTVGTIAGLPETWKSAVAVELAHKVAAGAGRVLGRLPVLHGGPVGYFWQDDSRENELRRLQGYAQRHAYDDVAVRWYLNEGLQLPADVGALRDQVERHGFVLVVLDSLYNFLPGIVLREEQVAEVMASLKTEVCDATGCTVACVDHAPWPTEGNKGQRRAYGSVFKAAAIRWSLFIERDGKSTSGKVTAGANNLAGLDTTPAAWDGEELELRLIATPTREGTIADQVVAFLERNFGATTSLITSAVPGRAADIRTILAEDQRIAVVPPELVGKRGNASCWGTAEGLAEVVRQGEL